MEAIIWFAWTLLAFGAGYLTHWWATRRQRDLLKRYQQQIQALEYWSKPAK